MERTRVAHRQVGWLFTIAALFFCGCQTVKIPEEKIAKANLPRELDKITMPEYVVEPPDIINVSVLEALPRREIGGEYLVRPDGKINLEYYGDVYVAGLTTDQIKEKVIIHLRKFITDAKLGLLEFDDEGKPKKDKDGNPVYVSPSESQAVSVSVASYNSKVFYVQGDVGEPGRYPIVGNETVLDALNFARGFTPTAANNNVRLVRPAPPGACCAQVLPVNMAAIINAGDTTTNYQLMPNDRLMVYRDPIVRTSVFLQRLAEPFSTVVQSIQSYGFAKYSLRFGQTGGVNGSSSSTRVSAPALTAPATSIGR